MISQTVQVFVPYGRSGGSTRVRVMQWLDRLDIDARINTYTNAADWRSSVLRDPRTLATAEFALRRSIRRALGRPVLMSRRLSPLSRGQLETRLLRGASWGVYDFDDALFADRRAGFRDALAPRAAWRAAVAAADVVIAGNDYLAEAAAEYASDVRVIPSCVDPSEYQVKRNFRLGAHPRIVWLGSPSTEIFLSDVGDAILEANRRYGARLVIISAGSRSLGRLDSVVDRVSWNESTFADVLATSDFGIAPLRQDAYAAGKCAYKLLQYGATALPVIGSPVGMNAEVLRQFGAAAPSDPYEWKFALAELIEASESTRMRLGAQARRVVLGSYSFQEWAGPWRDAVTL